MDPACTGMPAVWGGSVTRNLPRHAADYQASRTNDAPIKQLAMHLQIHAHQTSKQAETGGISIWHSSGHYGQRVTLVLNSLTPTGQTASWTKITALNPTQGRHRQSLKPANLDIPMAVCCTCACRCSISWTLSQDDVRQ